ncbi:MAG: hypothetical protein ACD_19C00123G0002 [uncultured bacterium]|nr:MAG: hypothetical protein ACD_19C00123G0002 [uncultured bacterium]
MKKLLPTSKGFTLIELLVVITIIGILAVAGFTVFTGVTTRGNDVRRQEDVNSIAKTLEVNKINTGYEPLAATQFAGGSIPTDPITTRVYCISYAIGTAYTAAPATLPTAWTAGTCPTNNGFSGTGATNWAPVTSSTPVTTTTAWKVCATLQNNTTVICKNSAQ